MPEFIPGLDLAEQFYAEIVRPILGEQARVAHAAALIGSGSEVLGFDTPQSTDHNWGPRVLIFLSDEDYARYADELSAHIHRSLPRTFRGYPTFYVTVPDEPGTLLPAPDDADPAQLQHRVQFYTVRAFFEDYVGFDPAGDVALVDWLATPQQILRTVTAGRVFADALDEPDSLTAIRWKLAYYPHDVWLYLLACQWGRIGQEEPFVGRSGDLGDELGSQIVAARLARDAMMLCFLMAKQYAPYTKWFGTAFSRLPQAAALAPVLQRALLAEDWRSREAHLCEAWELLARFHNRLGVTERLPEQVSPFHNRPYRVIQAGRFADALYAQIRDAEVKRLPRGLGSIDQFADSADLLSVRERFRKLVCFLQGE